MKQKTYLKKFLSLCLCTVMLFSTWVFTAPSVSAAQTDYKYKVRVNIDVSYSCALAQESYVDVEYDGGKTRVFQSGNNVEYGGGDHFYEVEIPSFPTNVRMNAHPWWWAGKLEYSIHCDVFNYNTNKYQELGVSNGYSAQGSSDHVATLVIPDSTRPYAAAIAGGISGPDTLTLDPAGGTVNATYKAGAVRDQYGYNLKVTPTVNCAVVNGLSFSGGTLSANADCNREEDYTVVVDATYGSAVATKTVTVKTFDYNVTFLGKDGETVSEQTGLKFGQSAAAPEPPVIPATNTAVYTFSHWDGEYTALSGAQNKTVQAVYEQSERKYTVTFKNWDGSVLGTKDYAWQEQVIVPESVIPTREADGKEYSAWVFEGWEPQIDKNTVITGDGMEFTAQFTGVKIPYTVRFMDDEGNDIINPQILNYGDMPQVPETVAKPADEQYEYRFIGWDKAVEPVSKSVIYTAQFLKTERKYTVTFLDADDTVIASIRNQRYGSVPAEVGIVPNYDNKEPDEVYHFTADWDNDVNAPIAGDTVFRLIFTPVEHTYSAWHTDSAATCETEGSESRTCAVCDYVQTRAIKALGHQMVLKAHNPTDGVEGYLYYECANGCGRYALCETDATGNAKEGAVCAWGDIQNNTLAVPSVNFNTYQSEKENYNYSTRGAALRIDENEGADTQAMRFIGSVSLPQGAEVVDFGYVYTREDKYKSLNKFVIGAKDVYDLSAMNGKYTDHESGGKTVRTFNLVMHIAKENWNYNYLARPYITYRFAGQTFTVYDSMFAARSVMFVANKIVASPTEPRFVKEFVENKILI